ncbi:SIMPL domain-containing protein [Streptomyces sulphureus]|uniref:SIMPL domain-containing protein n=1 Tax=Streptomyces sulphureus TaxID=47758 RepID=UPI000370C439|nr:SIMPL domain-containing protein [Streptomyces sulphureus]
MDTRVDQPWGVVVLGTATASAPPDLVRVRLAVDVTENDPSAAFDVARGAVGELRAVLRRHGARDEDVSVSQLELRTDWEWRDRRRTFLGYRCHADVAAPLPDTGSLEPFLTGAVGVSAVLVEDVAFDVLDRSRLLTAARQDAVRDARAKAGLYAEAAGAALGPVLHVEEVSEPRPAGFDGRRNPAPGDLVPGRVSVEAAVRVGFALRPGRYEHDTGSHAG